MTLTNGNQHFTPTAGQIIAIAMLATRPRPFHRVQKDSRIPCPEGGAEPRAKTTEQMRGRALDSFDSEP